MPRFETTIEATDKDGKAVDLSAQANANGAQGDPKKYQTVKPDYYYAVVTGIDSGHYSGKWGAFVNANSPDGKWNYEKIVPHFTLLNENGSEINRQDYTLGVYENGKFVRPDGKTQSPLMVSAQYLLTALGLFKGNEDDPSKFKLDVNFDLIKDRVVRVRTGISGYVKTPRLNFDEGQFVELMMALAGSETYTYEQVNGLVAKFNELDADALATVLGKVTKLYNAPTATDLVAARDGEGKEDAQLKTKNTISNVYAIKDEDAIANGWYYDYGTGGVFSVAAAWEQYIIADEEDRNYTPPAM